MQETLAQSKAVADTGYMEATTNLNLTEGDTVVTLDMDGTLEDPWACCGKRDRMGASGTCKHLRTDTVTRITNLLAVYPHAKLVVLSWRAGCEGVTRRWLGEVGIDVEAVFVPRSPDSLAIGAADAGQVGFKVNVVRALAAMGVEVLTGFDDNEAVVEALRAEGVPALLAPRLVQVERWEWAAGYLGAPKPRLVDATDFASMDLYNTRRAG